MVSDQAPSIQDGVTRKRIVENLVLENVTKIY
jgi:hypothetical protein